MIERKCLEHCDNKMIAFAASEGHVWFQCRICGCIKVSYLGALEMIEEKL